MITWTLTSGDRRADGAGTSYPEALAEALDAVLGLYDAHTADGDTAEALPVCTVQIESHEPIFIRDVPSPDRERGRRALAAHLTQALTDLTGDLFAQLPSVAAAHVMRLTHRSADTEVSRALHAPTGPLLSSVFPSPPRWALSVADARRCVPPARCALPGAMPPCGGYCAPAHPPALRPCQRGRRKVGPG